MMKDYEQKLLSIGKTSQQMLEVQRAEALKAASAFSDMGSEYTKLIEYINKYYDKLQETEAWDKFIDNAKKYLDQLKNLFDAVSNAVLAFMKRDTDAQIAEWERQNEALQEKLDEELQMRLYNAGLATAAIREQYELDLANAFATGDHKVIYEKEKALERYKIEKDVNDKKKASADKLAKDKAKAEYDYAEAAWKVQITQAHASIAQAHLTAAASAPWPYNLIPLGFATAIGVAQLAALQAAKPPPPKFANGGIVPGSSFSGDNVHIMANSGEEITTRNDKRRIIDAIDEMDNEDRTIHITVINEMDGEILSRKIFEIGSMGNAFIRQRGIVR
jgi:hypothetical protein